MHDSFGLPRHPQLLVNLEEAGHTSIQGETHPSLYGSDMLDLVTYSHLCLPGEKHTRKKLSNKAFMANSHGFTLYGYS